MGGAWNRNGSVRPASSCDRRTWMQQHIILVLSVVTGTTTAAAPARAMDNGEVLIRSIREAKEVLQSLLDNWQKAVIDCTYADVPRELLETKNKELLLEKASTFALFDKSVSVVSCKTSNRIVRQYLGRTGKGPLVGLDKKIRQALALVVVDDDDNNMDNLETFVQASEALQQALAKADSLSYAAGVADLGSLNNFDKADIDKVLASNSNLEEAKSCIQDAVDNLNQILSIIDPMGRDKV